LREIAAASDFDFVASERPARSKSKGSAKGAAKASAKGAGKASASSRLPAWAGKALANPAPLLAGGLFGLLLIAIPVNALLFQHARHPAPLFASFPHPAPAPSAQSAAAPATPESAPLPLPTPRPADLTLDSAPGAAPAPVAAVKAHGPDVIGALLNKSSAPSVKAVTSAQRALAKLGYGVKPDGNMGGATRQAIEKFERDRGLPVHGDLSAKVMRDLAARSGLPVE
jgi:hypothetical protein